MIDALHAKHDLLIAPVAMTNSATQTANLDTLGHDYATVTISLSAEKNTSAIGPTISFLESDDTVATNFATFDSGFERADEDITAAKNVVYNVDARARKRYLRLSITTETTTNDDVTVSASGYLTRKAVGPASTSDMVAETNSVVVIG